jgi:isoprenylcysteine carboxyl methyltransferase (ICMT) family protein YpbQ
MYYTCGNIDCKIQRTQEDQDFWQQTDPPSFQRLHSGKTKRAIVKTKTKIQLWALVGAWHKDKCTNWPPAARLLWLIFKELNKVTVSISHLQSSWCVLVLKLCKLQLPALNTSCVYRCLWHKKEKATFLPEHIMYHAWIQAFTVMYMRSLIFWDSM